MNPHRTMTRFMATVLVAATYLALTVASVGCGGGGNDSTTSSAAPVGIFTPDTPTPDNGSVTMLQGTTSGASVDVRVTVTEVANFFGAAFHVKYDPGALAFGGMQSATSFLNEGITDPSQLSFLAVISPGEVVITATRISPAVPVSVTTTSDLVILNFTARLPIAPDTAPGRLDFADPKRVCDDTVVPPNCGAISVTWSGGGISAQ